MKRYRWIVERHRRDESADAEVTEVNMTLKEVQSHCTALTDDEYFATAVRKGSSYARMTGRD